MSTLSLFPLFSPSRPEIFYSPRILTLDLPTQPQPQPQPPFRLAATSQNILLQSPFFFPGSTTTSRKLDRPGDPTYLFPSFHHFTFNSDFPKSDTTGFPLYGLVIPKWPLAISWNLPISILLLLAPIFCPIGKILNPHGFSFIIDSDYGAIYTSRLPFCRQVCTQLRSKQSKIRKVSALLGNSILLVSPYILGNLSIGCAV